jgi:hypothetical protein
MFRMNLLKILHIAGYEQFQDEAIPIEYFKVYANIQGNSGFIYKTFRAQYEFIEDGIIGEFEDISKEKHPNGEDNNDLEVYSIRQLVPNMTPPTIKMGDKTYFHYRLNADIEDPKYFRCLEKEPHKTLIRLERLYNDLVSIYEGLFSVNAEKDNVERNFKVIYD